MIPLLSWDYLGLSDPQTVYIAKDVVKNSEVPTTDVDKYRSVTSTIAEHSRTKLPTRQDRKAIYLHDYRKEHQVALSSAQTQERGARESMVQYEQRWQH